MIENSTTELLPIEPTVVTAPIVTAAPVIKIELSEARKFLRDGGGDGVSFEDIPEELVSSCILLERQGEIRIIDQWIGGTNKMRAKISP